MHKHSYVNDCHFSLSYNVTKKNSTFNFHAHDKYEIYYFKGGEIQYYIEDADYTMVAGDLLIIPPGQMHRVVTLDEAAPYERFVMSLSVPYCRRLLQRVPEHFVFHEMGSCQLPLGESRPLFEKMMISLLELPSDQAGLLQRDALVTVLLLELAQMIERGQVNQQSDHRMSEIIRYINANFTRDLTLEEIADRFFISKYYLLRRFKELTNSTVHAYILTKRILLAKALLQEGVSPADVGEQCGFASYTGFFRAFVSQTGVSPTTYIKK